MNRDNTNTDDQAEMTERAIKLREMIKALFDEMTTTEKKRLFRINILEADKVITDRERLIRVTDKLRDRVWRRVLRTSPGRWNRIK